MKLASACLNFRRGKDVWFGLVGACYVTMCSCKYKSCSITVKLGSEGDKIDSNVSYLYDDRAVQN